MLVDMLVASRGVTFENSGSLWALKFHVAFVFCVFLSVKLRAYVLCVSFFHVLLAILRSMLTVFFIFLDAGRG